jgi:hypothetical protein
MLRLLSFVFSLLIRAPHNLGFNAQQLAAAFPIEHDQFVKAIVNDFHRRIAFFLLGVGPGFMLKSHKPFRGSVQFHNDPFAFDHDVDLRDAVDMRFRVALFGGRSSTGNDQEHSEGSNG